MTLGWAKRSGCLGGGFCRLGIRRAKNWCSGCLGGGFCRLGIRRAKNWCSGPIISESHDGRGFGFAHPASRTKANF
jgi:hypothetical protein